MDMDANVQLLNVDTPTLNGRVYPRHVLVEALRKLANKPLAVVPVSAFLDNDGVPKVTDAIGVAENIRLDEGSNMVMAHVKVDRIPESLGSIFVFRTAGVGKLEGNTVTEFDLTSVVVAKE